MSTNVDFELYSQLISDYGSPLYVYELNDVSLRIQELRERLTEESQIYYSLKSNPLPSIVQHVADNGCRLEVTSENELNVACDTGIPKHRILYGGPGKTPDELRYALERGVTHFSVESWVDLQRINSLAHKNDSGIRILLRINPEAAIHNGLSMSGAKTQFGFEEKVLLDGWSNLSELHSNVSVIGFHIYYGTQMKDSEAIAKAAAVAIESVGKLCDETGFVPEVINLGGGFPWAYAQPQQESNLTDLKPALNAALASFKYGSDVQLWFESGRYLSASSGTLVSTVLDIKESKDSSRFVVLDAGINTLGGMSGLGRIPRGYMFIATDPSADIASDTSTFEASIVGPLCSPLDCMSRKHKLPASLKAGDLVIIPNVGAYGITASLIAFLTRPPALEVSLLNGSFKALHQLRHGHQSLG